jgi:hypothetical protein
MFYQEEAGEQISTVAGMISTDEKIKKNKNHATLV